MTSPSETPVRVLLAMSTLTAYFRFFEAPIRLLLARGHKVHVTVGRAPDEAEEAWLRAVAADHGALTWSHAAFLKHDPWSDFARDVVITRDYVHALRPRFAEAPSLVDARAQAHAGRTSPVPGAPSRAQRAVARAARSRHCGQWRMRSRRYRAWRSSSLSQRPDVLLVAPHLFPGSLDGEYVDAARAVGVPSAICVASWDNLSSKQLIRGAPDAVMVWNEIQRREAVELHGIPAERVVVTGAQCYDHWFSWARDRASSSAARWGWTRSDR